MASIGIMNARIRVRSMWRYAEMMPIFPGETPVTLGEGFTPLFHAPRLGKELGLYAALSSGAPTTPPELARGAYEGRGREDFTSAPAVCSRQRCSQGSCSNEWLPTRSKITSSRPST